MKFERYTKLTFCVLFVLFLLISCKEDKGGIGLGFQPENEFLNTDFVDTSTITAWSTDEDSVYANNSIAAVLGCLQDPEFGEIKTAIYAQFRLTQSNISPQSADSMVVDDLELILEYQNFYGDTNNTFLVEVFELSEDIKPKTNYLITSSFAVQGSSLVAGGTPYPFTPRPKTINDTNLNKNYAVAKIPLDTNFAKSKFIEGIKNGKLQNDTTFVDYFKGLCIKAETRQGTGSVVTVPFSNSGCFILMKYRIGDKHNQMKFLLSSDKSQRVGTAMHDYSSATANLQAQVINKDYSLTSQNLYIQSQGGVKTTLHFPHLKNTFKDKQVVIHRAVLVITEKHEGDMGKHPAPKVLALRYFDPSANYYKVIPDQYMNATAQHYDGTYNEDKKEYRFQITQYIQNLIDGKGNDYKIDLLISSSSTHLARAVLYGNNPSATPNKRLRLEINYTVVN